MKRFVTLLLVLCLFCALVAGCSGGGGGSDVDIDLTSMSTTMAQAEFRRLVMDAERYAGRTIRASGAYFTFFFDGTNQRYHFVTIVDGDDCCREGLEFRLTGDPVFPDDFPAENTFVEVTGTLGRYQELGQWFIYVSTDEIVTP